MKDRFEGMRRVGLRADFGDRTGRVDFSGHTTGIGGIHPAPMPERAREGIRALGFPLIRIFIQEFFRIEREDGRLDWSLLDPYMQAVAETGAKIMASICVKPKSMYPDIDERVFMPSDAGRWRRIVAALATRYSVERDWVTHWSVGNETNIGEHGGCPHLIESPDDYYEFYRLTSEPILKAAPRAKVGGPSFAGGGEDAAAYIGRFAERCRAEGVRVDFAAYNVYSDDPKAHAEGAKLVREAIGDGMELYVTELNVGIGGESSLEEKARDPKRAAGLAAILYDLNECGALTGTFQYHAYDQAIDPALIEPFFSRVRMFAEHWNDIPHRLGLFGGRGEPRPQYYLYRLLKRLAPERIAVTPEGEPEGLRALASLEGSVRATILIVNYDREASEDAVIRFAAAGFPEGYYRMTVRRIDGDGRYEGLEIVPTEDRSVYAYPDFHFDVYSPADSVTLIEFTRIGGL